MRNYNPNIGLPAKKVNSFLLTGLLLMFAFLFIYHNRHYFRKNIQRSFLHPHGFYSDIRDGRKIPNSHTVLISLFSSASISLLISSFSYYFRNNIIFDHLLTLIFFSPRIKFLVADVIQNPLLLLLFSFAMSYFYFLSFAVIFRIVLLLFKKRTKISRLISLSCWLGNVFLPTMPFAMIALRILQLQKYHSIIFLLCLLFVLWYFIRVITALRVTFMMPMLKVMVILLITAFIVVSGIVYFLQIQSGFWDYATYYWQLFWRSFG